MKGVPDHEAMQRHLLEVAQQELIEAETSYAADWVQDVDALAKHALYSNIAHLVDPKPGENVVDVGTGSGMQLVSLVLKCPEANIIGTERTQANVLAAFKFLQKLGLGNHVAAFSDSTLERTDDERAFWKRGSALFHENRDALRDLLKHKVLLLDDNILYPELLQELLPEGRVDAGILSMPGGSSSRIYEWPFSPRGSLGTKNHRQRTYDITNDTRQAFYHFMAEHMQPDAGRIVVAERMMISPTVPTDVAGIGLIRRQMGDLKKYWTPIGGAAVDMDFSETTVELRATDSDRTVDIGSAATGDHQTKVFMARFDRNKTPFSEPPLERPKSR